MEDVYEIFCRRITCTYNLVYKTYGISIRATTNNLSKDLGGSMVKAD